MLGLEVEASNYYSKNETDNLFTPITTFDDHEKRNVASFALIETELFRVAKEVILNFNGILINEDAIKENTAAIEENSDQIHELKKETIGAEDKIGEIKGTQQWANGNWNVSTNVDAGVQQCKVHADRTALVLNKDLIERNENNWQQLLAPYPAELGLEIDGKVYGVVLEFTGRAGQNNRGHNFKILSHNLPEDVANGTIVGLYLDFKAGGESILDTKADKKDTYTKDEVDNLVSSGEGSEGSEGLPALPEYDYYYLDLAGTSAGRVTLLDSNANRTSNLNSVRLIGFSGVDKNGKRWARDKDIMSYDRPFNGTANLLTEEGKVIMTVNSSGKATGIVTLAYFKDAIDGFCGPDTYAIDIPNSECITLTTRMSEISYPQKLYLHITGLHF
jgi:hypothetical protein